MLLIVTYIYLKILEQCKYYIIITIIDSYLYKNYLLRLQNIHICNDKKSDFIKS